MLHFSRILSPRVGNGLRGVFLLAKWLFLRYNSRKGCSRGFIGVAGGDSEEDIIWLRV
jgi:hypothetical protein